jgi:large subunit ribosomal protein L10
MVRPDKVDAVAEMSEAFTSSNAVVLTAYRGLSVAQLAELRRQLAGHARYRVVKNTLTRLAVRDAGLPTLEPLLEGSSAVAFVTGDPVEAAKGIRGFARTNPALVVKGGIIEGEPMDPAQIDRVAQLEPREVLLGKLAGGMKATTQRAAGLFAAPLAQAARAFGALQAKQPQPEAADVTLDEAGAVPEPDASVATEPDASVATEPDAAAPDQSEA